MSSACEGTYFLRMVMKVLNLEPSLGFSSVMAGGFSAVVGVVMLAVGIVSLGGSAVTDNGGGGARLRGTGGSSSGCVFLCSLYPVSQG